MFSEFLFPFDTARKEQDRLLARISLAIANRQNLLVHAPTGLGKTVSALGPALAHASKDDKLVVMFLTSRHTQHKLAIDTIRAIKEKYSLDLSAVSITGKMWMCAQPGVQGLYSGEFADYCRKLKENKKCMFFQNTRKSGKLTDHAKKVLSVISPQAPMPSEDLVGMCRDESLCPYEMAIALASHSKVIVTDYFYLFNPAIGEGFLNKIGKNLDQVIVIVDEAHNLPDRLKELASEYLSTITLKRAIQEAKKHGFTETVESLSRIQEAVLEISSGLGQGQEKLVNKADFQMKIAKHYDYEQLTSDLKFIGDEVRAKQKQSYTGGVGTFMEKWTGEDEGFARIISLKTGTRDPFHMLSYRCLDPSVVCADVINNTYSSILMSGTFQPLPMYKELLGVERSDEVAFSDPYPKSNRLNLIVTSTTTKYSTRSDSKYREMAEICSKIIDEVPGNSAFFFPSYDMRDKVQYNIVCKKPTFLEDARMGKPERQELIERFKSYQKTGASLLAVSSGSFGEGIDLPGDLLKCVVVVGLPLRHPDLETKSLIDYFDKKFKKGWDYGYIIPAMTRCIQNAGRCIRSENDRGVIIFLDERFAWQNYRRLFPEDWEMTVTREYLPLIRRFYGIPPPQRQSSL